MSAIPEDDLLTPGLRGELLVALRAHRNHSEKNLANMHRKYGADVDAEAVRKVEARLARTKTLIFLFRRGHYPEETP